MVFLKKYLWDARFKIVNDSDFKKLNTDRRMLEITEKEIKDLKARFMRPDGAQRKYRMLKFVNPPKKQFITLDNGQKQSVFDWFKQSFPNYTMKFPELPLIHCGDPKRTIYLPMELLELERQVSPPHSIEIPSLRFYVKSK